MAIEAPPPWVWEIWEEDIREYVFRLGQMDLPPRTWTSWWRSVSKNASVGGHPFSQHLIATAANGIWTEPFATVKARANRAGLVAVKSKGRASHLQLYNAGDLERAVRSVGYTSFGQVQRRFA